MNVQEIAFLLGIVWALGYVWVSYQLYLIFWQAKQFKNWFKKLPYKEQLFVYEGLQYEYGNFMKRTMGSQIFEEYLERNKKVK